MIPVKLQRHVLLISLVFVLLAFGCARIPVIKEKALGISPEEIPPVVAVAFGQAEDAYNKGEFEDAFDLYREVLNKVSSGKVAWWARLKRGEILITWDRFGEAINELGLIPKTREGDLLYATARTKLALAYNRQGAYDISDSLTESLLREKIPFSLRGSIYSIRGDNAADLEKPREAFEWYMRALEEPIDEKLRDYAGSRLESLIRTELSLAELEELEPSLGREDAAGSVYYVLALGYLDMGDLEKAEKYVDRFLERFKGHPEYENGAILKQRITERGVVDPYAVGCLLPLTGEFASYGKRALESIILAMGIFDSESPSPFKLVVEDTKSDPEAARQKVLKLANEDKVICIIGPLASTSSAAAAEEAQLRGVPIITLTPLENITEKGDYVFRNFLTAGMQVKTLVKYARENLGMKTFAILYPKDNYGLEMMSLFWDEVYSQGGIIRSVESYRPEQTDFGKEIKSLAGVDLIENNRTEDEEPKPSIEFDAVFIPDSYHRFSMIAPQLAFYNVTDVQLLGTKALNTPDLYVGESEYIEGSIFVDGFFLGSYSPYVRNFIDVFYYNFGRTPTDLEALSYDVAKIIAYIIKGQKVEVRGNLKEHLRALREYPGITGRTSFSETGDAQKDLSVLMIRNNEIVQIN